MPSNLAQLRVLEGQIFLLYSARSSWTNTAMSACNTSLQELICKSHLIWVIKGSVIHSQGLQTQVLVGRMWSPHEWALRQSLACWGMWAAASLSISSLFGREGHFAVPLSWAPWEPSAGEISMGQIFLDFFGVMVPPQCTPGSWFCSNEFSTWISLTSVSLRAFKWNKRSLSPLFTRFCTIIVWDPEEEWKFLSPFSSPDGALSILV